MNYIEKKHRLGLLVPSSNSTQEPEFVQMLPASVSLHVTRLSLSRIDPESTLNIVAELETESRKLADAAVDVVVLAATAPSTRMGKGYDAQLIKRMEEASGKPATTAATAMLDAFAALGVRRVALAAAWSETTNKWVAAFLESHGIEVLSQVAMGVFIDRLVWGRVFSPLTLLGIVLVVLPTAWLLVSRRSANEVPA